MAHGKRRMAEAEADQDTEQEEESKKRRNDSVKTQPGHGRTTSNSALIPSLPTRRESARSLTTSNAVISPASLPHLDLA